MPTGPLHSRITSTGEYEACRCMIGEEHDEHGVATDEDDEGYAGTTYCCGGIYEEGEDTCFSCGESL